MTDIIPSNRRGFMLVLSSPSGAGKTTVARHVLQWEAEMSLSISATTRPQRPLETDGVDYHFVDHGTFSSMVEEDHFLEHAAVFGHHYGTPRASIEAHLANGRDVLFDIDWQGTQTLKQKVPADVVSIFLLPPSLEILETRLRGRAEDPEETILLRMSQAANELSQWGEYDYVLINNALDASVEAVRSIVRSERLKRWRQEGLHQFVATLGS